MAVRYYSVGLVNHVTVTEMAVRILEYCSCNYTEKHKERYKMGHRYSVGLVAIMY